MPTRLHLKCGGCDAEAYSEPIRKTFRSFNGKGWGMGTVHPPDLDAAAPAGWIWSDPFTRCTYCPKCWKKIEAGEDAA